MQKLYFNCNGKIINNGDKTILAGILNVTPDSFSDGGKYVNIDNALIHVKKMIASGAKIIDIGGESTRPGSEAITEEEEISRVAPIIKAIRKEYKDLIISVDTWHSKVAKVALDEGADIINDITGLLGDDKMIEMIKNRKCGIILMFNPTIIRPHHEGSLIFRNFTLGKPFSIEELEYFSSLSIIDAMKEYFKKTLKICENAKIEKNRIMLDPGIGFGLTMRENLQLLNNIELIHEMGYLSFVGVSRKRFIINLLKDENINVDIKNDEGLFIADYASAFLSAIAANKGVNVLRVHDVEKHKQAILIGNAIRLSDFASNVNFSQYGKH